MTQLVIRLPEEQKALLELLANRRQVSLGELTREALKEYISKTKERSLFDNLLKIAKSKKKLKAPRDLSTGYKKYLYGK